MSSVTRTAATVGNCFSVTIYIAAYVSNLNVPPLGLPLITRLALCLSASVNGIGCLSMASMWPIRALQAVSIILPC